ncbi:hypothetical protein SEA_HOKKEND_221 [Mycobacterium phage HokkenD]|nr:hypothetical protein SEA_HOKKEND_221 [Mycobacterium phage HokkenD]
MSTITIKFRAKRDEYLDGFTLAHKYKVPAITHSHVTYPKRDSRVQIFLQGLSDTRVTAARLKQAGIGPIAFEHDGQWSITPIGNGFMADVSITVEI